MTLIDELFQSVADVRIPGFFITVEISSAGDSLPEDIEAFLNTKHQSILQGATGRKFVYREGEWRMTFTFFPTDRTVDERYALKNKVLMKRYHS